MFGSRIGNNSGDDILLINPIAISYHNGYGFLVLHNGDVPCLKNEYIKYITCTYRFAAVTNIKDR